jgi:hypothetical protein
MRREDISYVVVSIQTEYNKVGWGLHFDTDGDYIIFLWLTLIFLKRTLLMFIFTLSTHINVRIAPKYDRKILKTWKFNTTNTHLHGLPLSWIDTGTAMKSDGVKLV